MTLQLRSTFDQGPAIGAGGGPSEWDGAVCGKSLSNLLKICPFAAMQIS